MDKILPQSSFLSHPTILLIKLIAIVYYGAIYSCGGMACGILLDTYLIGTTEDKEKNKELWQLLLEIIGIVGLLAIVAFIGRNVLQTIPFPFDKMKFDGIVFDINKVKEYSTGAIFATFLVLFTKAIITRATILRTKLSN